MWLQTSKMMPFAVIGTERDSNSEAYVGNLCFDVGISLRYYEAVVRETRGIVGARKA